MLNVQLRIVCIVFDEQSCDSYKSCKSSHLGENQHSFFCENVTFYVSVDSDDGLPLKLGNNNKFDSETTVAALLETAATRTIFEQTIGL